MKIENFFRAIDLICEEKNLPKESLYEKVGNAIVTAVGHDYTTKSNIFCDIDADAKTVRIYKTMTVVATDEDVSNFETEMTVDEAQKYKSGSLAGDIVEIELDINASGRNAAQTVKHVLRQGIKDVEKEQMLKRFNDKNQENITAVVKGIDSRTESVIVEINKKDAYLSKKEQIPGEKFAIGQSIKVYIVDVASSEKGAQLLISRTHPDFVKRLFEQAVTEISDGIVEVKRIAREAGLRTKMAVYSKDEDVDPIGACIGQKGDRINEVVSNLNGEKIDIVKFSDDPAEFIAAALAPAKVLSVEIVNEAEKRCAVTVPDAQVSLAIGNKGLNARLAAKLTGWKIDISPESGFYQPKIQL